MEIIDRYGVGRDWDWLVRNYGPLVIHPAAPGSGWRVVRITENGDRQRVVADTPHTILAPAVIQVATLDANGWSEPGVPVAWYWANAPVDPNAGPANGLPAGMVPGRALMGVTNDNGTVEFAMGGGAYYWPPAIGPHAVWMHGADVNSDVAYGLGMKGGTNHDSLWLSFQYCEGEGEPEPPEPPQPPVNEVATLCDQIVAAVEEIRRLAGQ